MRKDSEISENTLSDEGKVSETQEDIMLNADAFSTDSSFSVDNDGFHKQIEQTSEQLFTVTRSGRTTETYKRADYLF